MYSDDRTTGIKHKPIVAGEKSQHPKSWCRELRQ